MTRRISSKWTSAIPVLILIMYAPVVYFHVATFDAQSLHWWGITSGFVIANIVGLIVCPLPKHIDVGDQCFTVTGLPGRSLSLPLTAIKDIKSSWLSKTVTITLNVDSKLGRKISFMPIISIFSHPALGHADVHSLQQAVADARIAFERSVEVSKNTHS